MLVAGVGQDRDLVIDRVVGGAIWVTGQPEGPSVVVSGRAGRAWWCCRPGFCFLGEVGDALVGVEHHGGAGPAVKDANNVSAGSSHDAGWGVPQLPAQRFRLGDGEGSAETEQLEPADQIGGVTDHGEPGLVGFEVAEGEAQQPGGFEPADVVLDMSVGAHVGVEDHRIAAGVGVVTPVAEQKRRKQGGLGAGMQRFASHDQPGPFRPAAQIDEVGDLRHR